MAKSFRAPIGNAVTLAAADDLNGGTTTLDLSGKAGAIIIQVADGTAGTTGIDVLEISHDGGENWTNVDGLLDDAGAAVTDGILNAAGVEPTGAAAFVLHAKNEDLSGPVLIRLSRLNTANADSAAWTTGAPWVIAFPIGG